MRVRAAGNDRNDTGHPDLRAFLDRPFHTIKLEDRLLAATIDAALAGGAVKPASLTRMTIDTTVQPKAIAFPTDSRLYHRGREILVRLAAKHAIRLQQSYHRLGKRAPRLANRYAHARQMRRARREIEFRSPPPTAKHAGAARQSPL